VCCRLSPVVGSSAGARKVGGPGEVVLELAARDGRERVSGQVACPVRRSASPVSSTARTDVAVHAGRTGRLDVVGRHRELRLVGGRGSAGVEVELHVATIDGCWTPCSCEGHANVTV
jgi:hypothetical protein